MDTKLIQASVCKVVGQLSVDVDNPDYDLRAKYNWLKFPSWKKGKRFLVETFDVGKKFGDAPSGVLGTMVVLASSPYGDYMTSRDPRFEGLVASLEPCEKTVDTIMSEGGESRYSAPPVCLSMFKWMVQEGRMTVDEFEALYKEYSTHNLTREP
jgi:hypothetical protein